MVRGTGVEAEPRREGTKIIPIPSVVIMSKGDSADLPLITYKFLYRTRGRCQLNAAMDVIVS